VLFGRFAMLFLRVAIPIARGCNGKKRTFEKQVKTQGFGTIRVLQGVAIGIAMGHCRWVKWGAFWEVCNALFKGCNPHCKGVQ
jgi:hypothetical protein